VTGLRLAWWRFLAYFRLNQRAICEMSKGRGMHDDYHDYADEDELAPATHEYLYKCRFCGKEFYI
jgi:hypothetical protein